MTSSAFPMWGPYGKKYMGISRIAEHKFKSGVRFDFTVAPAIFGTDIRVPNVTVPSGCHPWLSSGDYSFFSYRYDLEWKDKVYADVSFSKIDDENVLVRTEIFNNSELSQNCLINYFSSIEYPHSYFTRLVTPEKCVYKEAIDYSEYFYAITRPWDEENPDGLKKGEIRDPDFVNESGLGDRVGKWHMPHRVFKPFGGEKGDTVKYEIENDFDFKDAVLLIRYRTCDIEYRQGEMVGVNNIEGKEAAVFTLNDEINIRLEPTNELKIAAVPIGELKKASFSLSLVSKGCGAAEFDFFCITEIEDFGKIRTIKTPYEYIEKISYEPTLNGEHTAHLTYKDIDGVYTVKTFNENTRYRNIETGSLEDCLSARLSNSDVTFDDVTESFTNSFKRKHSDDGFFHNTIVHTLFIEPGKSHAEYAVIGKGDAPELKVADFDRIYNSRKAEAITFNFNKNGKKYELSNTILAATLMNNAVYPIYKHGENIIHHTPGKRWDCLYTWDSGFIGLGMAKISPRFAEYSLNTYFSDESNKDYAFLLHGSPVPVQMYLYLEMLKNSSDKEKLLSMYPRAKLYYDFLAGKVRGSTTAKFKSGLTTTYDYFYSSSGMDDYPAQVLMMNKNVRDTAAPAISSSQLIRCAKILKMVSEKLGKTEDEKTYEADIRRVGEALNKYSWDEECGYYSYVLHDENYEPSAVFKDDKGENINKGLDGIYPLIAGVCNEKQKARIIGHLQNEKEMLSPYGISAVDMTAGYFTVNGYWNGNVWFPHQWFIWKTMLDMGEKDFAFEIARRALDVWKREVDYSYYTFEMVNVVTGRGGWFHNFGGLSSPIILWASAYFKPGTFNSGFDVWVNEQSFSNDNTCFKADISYFGTEKEYTVIAAMSDKKSYTVTVDGEKTDFVLRENSAVEITIFGDKKNRIIEIK